MMNGNSAREETSNFCKAFKEDRHHVLYGLTAVRERYLTRLSEARVKEVVANRRNYIFPAEKGEYEYELEQAERLPMRNGMMASDYHVPVQKGEFTRKKVNLGPVKYDRTGRFRLRFERYREALESHPKYSPHLVRDLSIKHLSKNDLSLLDAEVEENAVNDALGNQASRRACKFSLEYFSRHAQVHYVLDEIDMQDVVDKKTRILWWGREGVPLTTSELRFLHKHWKKLNTKNIHFYLDEREVEAPWIANPEMWEGRQDSKKGTFVD
ncbi:MAG: hypothetical protein WB791_05085 [Waddliaceae bacterium]